MQMNKLYLVKFILNSEIDGTLERTCIIWVPDRSIGTSSVIQDMLNSYYCGWGCSVKVLSYDFLLITHCDIHDSSMIMLSSSAMFEVDSRDGLLIFGNIHIQTGDEEEEENTCYYCKEYEDSCTCYDDDLEEDEDDSLSIDEDSK